MTVQELNTFHTVCELERKQLLTYLQLQYKFYNVPVFFQQEIEVIFHM